MPFDFNEQFTHYSNVELLQITLQPGQYQPEAVAAATRILNERQVSVEDTDAAADFVQHAEEKKQRQKEATAGYQEKAWGIVEPFVKPGGEVKPEKWLTVFLVVVGAYYLWGLFQDVKKLFLLIQCDSCSTGSVEYLSILASILYTPFLLYLLWKRNRWGWILLTGGNIIALVFKLGNLYSLFKYQELHRGDAGSYIMYLLLSAGFVFFLLQKKIRTFFSISFPVMKTTVIAAGSTALVIILILSLLTY